MRSEPRSREPEIQWPQVDVDLQIVLDWARTVAESTTCEADAERRRAALDRCSRHVLRALDADVDRLRAATAASRALGRRRLATEGPGPHSDVHDLAAALGHRAEHLVRATGLPSDAGPAARRAVIAEADPVSPEGWLGRRRATWRRRVALILEVARR